MNTNPFFVHKMIGAQSTSKLCVCSGAASKSLYGTAEAMWRPNLTPEELVQVCGRGFGKRLFIGVRCDYILDRWRRGNH